MQLTCQKGTLSYIVSHTWKATTSFEKMRRFVFDNYTLMKIVNLNFGVFDATIKPVVILIVNNKESNYDVKVYDHSFKLVNNVNISDVTNDPQYKLDSLSSAEQKRLFLKIESNSKPLSDVIRFSRGIKTSNDKRFILKNKKNSEYKKIFRGKNIKAYQLNWGEEYIWYRPDLMKEKAGCLPCNASVGIGHFLNLS